ncbi:hypothetical protein COOONC_24643, partial [Cooperia oncophora]
IINNGSTISSSNSSSIASSSTYTSIPDVSSTPKKNASTSTSNQKISSTPNQKATSLAKPGQVQAPSAKTQLTSKSAITKPTALKPPATTTAQATDPTPQSKMLKLKVVQCKGERQEGRLYACISGAGEESLQLGPAKIKWFGQT